jgi:hypothetical protein
MEDPLYTINCFLNADYEQSFDVQLNASNKVGDLKYAIARKRSLVLKGIDPVQLTLYHAVLQDSKDLAQEVSRKLSENPAPLMPSWRLSDIFSTDPPERMVHIIVQPPPSK